MSSRLRAGLIAAAFVAGAAPWAQETADDFLRSGNQLQRERNYVEAIEAYRQGIEQEPDQVELHYQLGVALRKADQLEQAVTAGQRAVELDPSYIDAYVELGRAYTRWIQDRAALLHEEIAAGGDIEAHVERGVFLSTVQRYDESVEVFEAALQEQPDHTLMLRELTELYLRRQRYEDCIRTGERAIELGAASRNTLLNLGEAYLRRGRSADAIELFRNATHRDPDFVEGHLILAKAYERSGRLEDSIASYRRALIFQPDRKETRYSLAGVYRRNKDQQAFEREMQLYELLEFKAEIPKETEIEMIEGQLALNPLEVRVPLRRLAVLHGELGNAHEKDLYGDRVQLWEIKEEMDFAIAGFRQVAELHPAQELWQQLQGIAAFRREFGSRSNRALEYDLELAATLVANAQEAFRRGDRDEAIRSARRALNHDPGSVPAHHLLAEIYSVRKIDLSFALRLAGRALDMDPSKKSYAMMAEVYRRRGNQLMADKLDQAASRLD